MRSKEQKRKEALQRVERNLESYQDGDWEPSQRDVRNGVDLEEKIERTFDHIEHLRTLVRT